MNDGRANKRRRLDEHDASNMSETFSLNTTQVAQLQSVETMNRDISPPRRQTLSHSSKVDSPKVDRPSSRPVSHQVQETIPLGGAEPGRVKRSPISLTRITDLSESFNIDTVRLTDLLSDPLIKEVWIFNYLHDIDFIVSALDSDVRDTVQVKVVHGNWKREDGQRMFLEEQAKRYSNVEIIIAHMPEMFGTHHSKAFFFIRHDDHAQVVIHTANMVRQDWTNLTQAVWRSPLLPLVNGTISEPTNPPIGSGHRFKIDIVNYLRYYGSRTKKLTDQLNKYDFSAIRAALVSSVPCKQTVSQDDLSTASLWGWRGLQRILETVPMKLKKDDQGPSQIVIQVSSIASLGPSEKWFSSFLNTLVTTSRQETSMNGEAKSGSGKLLKQSTTVLALQRSDTKFNIIFPTHDEVRRSLDGYSSGSAIHLKIHTAAAQQQLRYLRPLLRHWDGDPTENEQTGTTDSTKVTNVGAAGRRRAAPHIKTYIRYSSSKMDRMDWAMLTSANLSKQAWGEMEKNAVPGGEVRISSYELGVVFWPSLFKDTFLDDDTKSVSAQAAGVNLEDIPKASDDEVIMVPVFRKDVPEAKEYIGRNVVGFRMPYDLPLRPYAKDDMPWCATSSYEEPDWRGLTWNS